MVEYISRKDPSTLESRDETSSTPLIIAAASTAATGKLTSNASNDPAIDLLPAFGARKDTVNSKGMTAYGTLLQMHNQFNEMLQAMMGMPARGASSNTPGLSRLMPPGGPTTADRTEGQGAEEGFVDYSEEDADRVCQPSMIATMLDESMTTSL
mmetsp:Transcript_6809/g.15880  ORF Transcript_6809/g.15880 Transcript_6809/m.15880 type:complete len:154 (-) Transcript_6809:51-512(-)